MSFHAHVRKLLGSQGKGTTLKKPLENFRCSLKPNCDAHKPFPKGICTKCKPQVVTLNRQKFRHVDNIQIENQELVNQFLDYWRLSGHQRVGFLIGQYQPHLEVPLGIKVSSVLHHSFLETSYFIAHTFRLQWLQFMNLHNTAVKMELSFWRIKIKKLLTICWKCLACNVLDGSSQIVGQLIVLKKLYIIQSTR